VSKHSLFPKYLNVFSLQLLILPLITPTASTLLPALPSSVVLEVVLVPILDSHIINLKYDLQLCIFAVSILEGNKLLTSMDF